MAVQGTLNEERFETAIAIVKSQYYGNKSKYDALITKTKIKNLKLHSIVLNWSHDQGTVFKISRHARRAGQHRKKVI